MRRRAVQLNSLVNKLMSRLIACIPKQSWKVNLIWSVVIVFLEDPLQRLYYLNVVSRLLRFQNTRIEQSSVFSCGSADGINAFGSSSSLIPFIPKKRRDIVT